MGRARRKIENLEVAQTRPSAGSRLWVLQSREEAKPLREEQVQYFDYLPASKALLGQVGIDSRGEKMQLLGKQDGSVYLRNVESDEVVFAGENSVFLKEETISFPAVSKGDLLRIASTPEQALRLLADDGSLDCKVEDVQKEYCQVGNWVLHKESGEADRAMEFIHPQAAADYMSDRLEDVRAREGAAGFGSKALKPEDDFDQTCCQVAAFIASGKGDASQLAEELVQTSPEGQAVRAKKVARTLQSLQEPLPGASAPEFTTEAAPLWREVQALRTSHRSDLLLEKMRRRRQSA